MRFIDSKTDSTHDDHGQEVEPSCLEPLAEERTAVIGEDERFSWSAGSATMGVFVCNDIIRSCRACAGDGSIARTTREETHSGWRRWYGSDI